MTMRWTAPIQLPPPELAPNLRPAWLKDRGGAGGPQQLLGPNADLGQPSYSWVYTFYANGAAIAKYGPYTRTVDFALIALLQAWKSWKTTAQKTVCASYIDAGGNAQMWCTSDGSTYQKQVPPPLPTALPYRRSYVVQETIVRTSPFIPIPFRATYRPAFGPFAVAPAPFYRPPFVVLRGTGGRLGQGDLRETATYKSCMANLVQSKCASLPQSATAEDGSTYSPFDICVDQQDSICLLQAGAASGGVNVGDLQNRINAVLASQGICAIGVDGKLGPNTCSAAIYAQPYDASITVPAQCTSILDSSVPSWSSDCKTGAGGGPPPPECTGASGCDPTKDCVDGKCVDKCPTGYERGPDGSCVVKVATAGVGSGSGLGWLLGIGAAVAAIFFGLRAPNLPKQPARARAAKRGRTTRRRAA